MSEIIIPQGVQTAEAPADDGKFFFTLTADETGITGFKFRKDAEKLFGVLLFGLESVNSTFDTPFPTVGDFCRHLGTVADQVEAAYMQQKEQGDDQAGKATDDAA